MQDIFVFLDLKVFNTDNSYMFPRSRFKHFDPIDPDPSTLVSSIQRIKPQNVFAQCADLRNVWQKCVCTLRKFTQCLAKMCLHTVQTYAMFDKNVFAHSANLRNVWQKCVCTLSRLTQCFLRIHILQ